MLLSGMFAQQIILIVSCVSGLDPDGGLGSYNPLFSNRRGSPLMKGMEGSEESHTQMYIVRNLK